jgi:nucleotide-binding universal stress UspA family protein
MKTILVPASGTQTDSGVFATALALARLVRAHMQFYHLRLDPCEAALRDPHAQFCIGPAISATLSSLEKRDAALSAGAVRHFMDFCERHQIPILEAPVSGEDVSAQWLEETNYPEDRLLFHARHSDITVLGRRHSADFMPQDLIEMLLKKSGRPIVIAPDTSPNVPIRTVAVGWNETGECARALSVAAAVLTQAERVILLTVTESPEPDSRHLSDLTRQLAWSGIVAQPRVLADPSRSVARQLLDAATQIGAGLLVVGGYGHSSFREQVFGGVTRELVDTAELPVFLMH